MYKVVIVEDEEIIRKGLIYTFPWDKHDLVVVAEAINGIDGMEKISSTNPDIVIVDLNMPVMDGLTMIRNTKDGYNYCAIILSGYGEFKFAKEAIHLGVTEYLLKPVDTEQLTIALDKAKKNIEIRNQYSSIIDNKNDSIPYSLKSNLSLLNSIPHPSYQVSQMLKYIEENFNQKISILDLVEKLNLSTTSLNHEFKKETSYTFNDYVNRYRITQAIKMLENGNEKIYNIASSVGFKDYRYFINVFKKYTGCLPSDFTSYFRK